MWNLYILEGRQHEWSAIEFRHFVLDPSALLLHEREHSGLFEHTREHTAIIELNEDFGHLGDNRTGWPCKVVSDLLN